MYNSKKNIVQVVNIKDPIPGDWNITAASDSAHSVRLTALSDINFNFGFSLQTPNKIAETIFNPLLGKSYKAFQPLLCSE